MTEMATRYTPKAGSLPHRVLTFMVLNPDEELTRSDIATKFDCTSSSVDAMLALPVTRGVLSRKRNSEMEVVWCLGDSRDFLLEAEDAPSKLPARCMPRGEKPTVEQHTRASFFPAAAPVILTLGDIKVRKGVPLMTKEERRRAEFVEWFKQFCVGDSAEFDDMHLPTMKAECSRFMRETKTKFRFAETGPGRTGVERTA